MSYKLLQRAVELITKFRSLFRPLSSRSTTRNLVNELAEVDVIASVMDQAFLCGTIVNNTI